MANYQNGKIYKIEALNGEEGDVYIGSTCKQYLSQRMDSHRSHFKCWKEGKSNNVTSYGLFDKYGVDNCIIVLIENFSCNSKDELYSREAFYIKSIKCINKNIPLRTNKEYNQDNKELISENSKIYRKENKEKLSERKKTYYGENKGLISENSKIYHKENKEKLSIQQKIYYENNKDKILDKFKKYYQDNKDKIYEQRKKIYQENKEKLSEQRKKIYQKNKEQISLKGKTYYEENKHKITEKITCECGSICNRSGILKHKRSIKHIKYEESI
jgi:hypothetical protein